MTTKKLRWRNVLECQYREVKRKNGYFNRKTYKKIIKLWDRASRLGLIDETLSEFNLRISSALSHGMVVKELNMSISQLEKSLDNLVKFRKGLDK